MDGGERAVVAGVHGLQKVERFGSAHFAHDDALRTHTQTVSDQIAHGDLPLPFEVGRAGFQAHHMGLLQLQFGGVFAGDDAFIIVDELSEAIQKRGFPGAGAADDETLFNGRDLTGWKGLESFWSVVDGAIVGETTKEKPTKAEVVAVGPGKALESGELRPLSVKPGDKVLVGKYAGTEIKIDGEEFLMMREEDILGVLASKK